MGLNKNYLVDTLVGSNNQPIALSISFNSDMIIIPSAECTLKCDKKSYDRYWSNTEVDVVVGVNYTSMDFANFTANPSYQGNLIKDRICLKDAPDSCLNVQVTDNNPEFFYVKSYYNPIDPTSNFKSAGILGLAPTGRTSTSSYLEYLFSKNLI